MFFVKGQVLVEDLSSTAQSPLMAGIYEMAILAKLRHMFNKMTCYNLLIHQKNFFSLQLESELICLKTSSTKG
jgi:hypothetical protein